MSAAEAPGPERCRRGRAIVSRGDGRVGREGEARGRGRTGHERVAVLMRCAASWWIEGGCKSEMLDSLLGSPMLGQTLRHLGRSSTAGQLRYLSSARTLVVLALESSADDTCAAVLSSAPGARTRILSNVVLKQSHEALGGIEPLKAQLLHQERMPSAVQLALREAGVTLAELDGIAFTRGEFPTCRSDQADARAGPGMLGCLSVCASAKTLAGATGLPLLGVHHMQAHALTVFLTEPNPPAFPFLTLLLSGGHTMLVLAKSEASFTILANCNDESIG